MKDGKFGVAAGVAFAVILLMLVLNHAMRCSFGWVTCVAPWNWWYRLGESDQASWVEAVGTVGAILATGLIFLAQRRHEIENQLAAKKEEWQRKQNTQFEILNLFGTVIATMQAPASTLCEASKRDGKWVELLNPIDWTREALRKGTNNLNRFSSLFRHIPPLHVSLLLGIELAIADIDRLLEDARFSIEKRPHPDEDIAHAISKVDAFLRMCDLFQRTRLSPPYE